MFYNYLKIGFSVFCISFASIPSSSAATVENVLNTCTSFELYASGKYVPDMTDVYICMGYLGAIDDMGRDGVFPQKSCPPTLKGSKQPNKTMKEWVALAKAALVANPSLADKPGYLAFSDAFSTQYQCLGGLDGTDKKAVSKEISPTIDAKPETLGKKTKPKYSGPITF